MLTIESLPLGLDILNAIVTDDLATIRSLKDGRLALSSGRAEAKSQSSSAVAPLLGRSARDGCVVELPRWADGAKLKMEGEGEALRRFKGGAFDIGDGCRGGGDPNEAKGSEGRSCGDWDGWEACEGTNDGPGVDDRDDGCEVTRDAKGL
jgi:hypothetical protein